MKLPDFPQSSWPRRAAWTLLGLVAVWALAWLAVPPLARSQIEKLGSQALGRAVTVGALDFKPWTLELTVTDLAVAKQDGSGPQLSIQRIYVDADLLSLLRMAPVMDAIAVDAPKLNLTHLGGGHYDVDDILERLNAASAGPASAPPKFALYNLVLTQGTVDLTDRTSGAQRKHSLRAVHLVIPFLSNQDAQREVKVDPRLAFELNGSKFDTAAEGTPFAQTRKGDATLTVAGLDLAPYLAYLPPGLPVQLKAAVVDADLRLNFEQTRPPHLGLTGRIKVSGLKLADAKDAEMLDLRSIQIDLADVRPLEEVIKLASVEVVAPRLRVARKPTGREEASSAAGKPGTGWTFRLAQLGLHQGEITWMDDSIQPHARLALNALELQAKDVQWPFTAPATFEGSATMSSMGKSVTPNARIAFKGQATDRAGKVHASLGDIALSLAAPYMAQYVAPNVAGVLDAELDAQWAADTLQLVAPRVTLRDFVLSQGQSGASERSPAQRGLAGSTASEWPQFKLLEITDTRVDITQRTASVGKIALHAPSATARRDAQGQWMFAQWLKSGATSADANAKASRPVSPWKLSVGELLVDGATVGLDDRSLAKPVRLEVTGLNVQAKRLALDGKKPARLSVSAHIRSGRTEAGTLKYRGTVMWDPLLVQGTLEAVDIPAHTFAPYLANQLNMELLRADTSFKGQFRYAASSAGAQVQVRGDAALEDFRANSGNEELLSWKSLNVPGIVLDMAAGSATRVQVREAALSDFFARVIISPSGRLNLQDLLKPDKPDAESAAAPVASQSSAVAPTPEVHVQVGPISLVKGRVLFSDRFIQPNYSADLSELTGKLGQFSSEASDGVVQLADLDVRGRAEGTATLEILGKVNPLSRPLALDISARVRDLELPPLSPYAVKYAGYGIERGKLSVNVNYKVEPDGQLSASNNIVLNQLSFGDKVEGAPNSLPVKLAAALLADRNGVIDLNLPISGSLNDPEFKLGAVVWKVISNLVVKAITSPFSLLAKALGGGTNEALSTVAFAPGSSELGEQAKLGLDKVVKALTERPTLVMTVVGMASVDMEREAVKEQQLHTQLLAEKRRRAVVSGKDAADVQDLDAQEVPGLLRAVYRRADIAKPRNLVGLIKDIAPEEMQALLLSNITVNEDAVRELALQRGVAVKDYLASRQLPVRQLFLGAPKVVKVQTAEESAWSPHAELSLTQ